MPLLDLGAATLEQMADPKLATPEEISALGAWRSDVTSCRERLLQVIDVTIPSFGPIIEASRDEDDAVFVKLAHHEIRWGQAVLRLRRNGTKQRADLIAHADRVVSEVGKLQQEQLNRRSAVLNSVIGILP